ncbi:hypothetical protein SAB1565 [Staphylococcus aureus RF122]|nr:hypothetical protein SAB1565 [Staphylococcus aureus RF122]
MTVVLVFLYYSLSNQQLVSNKTILNQKHNQYHNPAGVDYGAPTWKLTKKSAYYNVQVGVGPNIENFEKKFYRQCKLGWAPTWKLTKKSAYNNVQVEVGPNIENFEKKFYRQCKLGWAPTWKLTEKSAYNISRI